MPGTFKPSDPLPDLRIEDTYLLRDFGPLTANRVFRASDLKNCLVIADEAIQFVRYYVNGPNPDDLNKFSGYLILARSETDGSPDFSDIFQGDDGKVIRVAKAPRHTSATQTSSVSH